MVVISLFFFFVIYKAKQWTGLLALIQDHKNVALTIKELQSFYFILFYFTKTKLGQVQSIQTDEAEDLKLTANMKCNYI